MQTRVCLWVMIASAVGCGTRDTGDVDVGVEISALSAADVVAVHVTVSGPGMADQGADLVRVGATYRGTLGGIPVGDDRVFTGDATDSSGTVIFHGASAPVTIVGGQTALVDLQLTSTTPPDPFQNHAPVIDSLFVSAQAVVPGATITLAASAHDPDLDPITYAWLDQAYSDAQAPTTTWVAPATEGSYTLRLRATDSHDAFDEVTVTIDVHASNGTGQADISASVNTSPVVEDVTVDSGRLLPGIATAAHALAFDPDGDAMTFAWISDCNADFAGAGADVMITIPAASTATSCTVHVDVTDTHGGTNFGELVAQAGAGPNADFAPVIDTTFQSVSSVHSGEQVVFRVVGHDPEGGALHFGFSTSSGSTVSDTATASELDIVWQASSCFLGGADITVQVYDVNGNVTAVPFHVAALDTTCPLTGTPPNLIAYWPGDGNATDVIGGRALISYTGTYTAGVRGQAFLFNGSQGLRASGAGLPLGNADRTFEMWFRVDFEPTTPNHTFLGGYGTFGQIAASYELGVFGDALYFSQWGDGSIQAPSSPIAVGAFHHVAVTNAGSVVSLYLDGVLVKSGPVTINTTAGDMLLGYLDPLDAKTHTMTGAIDEVRIFDRALSAAEIASIAAGNGY